VTTPAAPHEADSYEEPILAESPDVEAAPKAAIHRQRPPDLRRLELSTVSTDSEMFSAKRNDAAPLRAGTASYVCDEAKTAARKVLLGSLFDSNASVGLIG